MSQQEDKQFAARAAAEEVRDGMLVGLGTGSTAAFLIAELGRRVQAGLRIEAVATSEASEAAARAVGIPLLDMSKVAAVDVAIDGADEVDGALRAIKGAGGAMLREKVVAAAAKRMVVIVDRSKQVSALGKMPVPVEVLPFAVAFVAAAVLRLGGDPVLRARVDGAAYRTDQGNAVLDCRFPSIPDPEALGQALSAIPGLLGHGLFLDEVDAVYVSENGHVSCLERPGGH